jgi:hypothetical protein
LKSWMWTLKKNKSENSHILALIKLSYSHNYIIQRS